MTVNIDFYNDNHKDLTEQYNSLSFENVHKSILSQLPLEGNVLDIGCGSGRDAFALANKGLTVTAVDPSTNMLNSAKNNFSHDNITWIQDELPTLNKLKAENKKFDFILLSAVWMHIEQKDREEAFKTLQSLLNKNAKMVISLRHGVFHDARKEIKVSSEEVEGFSNDLNIISKSLLKNDKDALNRSEVSWEIVMFQNTQKRKLTNKIKK
jgi:2-polyprenyl-3-methyl-5-hydroxy-6-metoxy-1,4-benzoquinol methylase